jgi:hypothetical protein
MALIFPGSYQGKGVTVDATNSTAAQVLTAATRTLIGGTLIKAPVGGLKVGSKFTFRVAITKTAAGTATSVYDIGFGTVSTGLAATATARVSFTKPAGTAAVDEGVIEVEAVVRAVSATVGVVQGQFVLAHNLAATGHADVPVVVLSTTSASFDNSAEELYIGLYATTGAADVITISQASAALEVPTNGATGVPAV